MERFVDHLHVENLVRYRVFILGLINHVRSCSDEQNGSLSYFLIMYSE